MTKHQVYHERTKHIDVVSREVTNMKKISIEDNPADMLTKAIPIAKFKHCCDLVNVKTR